MSSSPAQPRILTFTHARDMHSVYVSGALDLLGEPNEVVVLDSMLQTGGVTISEGSRGARLSVRDQGIDVALDHLKAHWNRRRPLQMNHREDSFGPDRPYLESCAVTVSRSISLSGNNGFSVNPATGILLGGDKFAQLRAAKAEGFYIPDTLISSDAEAVARFRTVHSDICAKSVRTINWLNENRSYGAFTTIIPQGSALPRESVELTPTIYQEVIPKLFEVRLTVFGRYYCCTKIDSQKSESTSMDWRRDLSYLRNLTDISIDDGLHAMARGVLQRLGLRFGTFDLAFNKEKGWVFFEVNESGQFLWQETYSEDAAMLEPFARYLASGDDNFTFDKSKASHEIRMATLKPRLAQLRQYEKMMAFPHVPIGTFYLIDETVPAPPHSLETAA